MLYLADKFDAKVQTAEDRARQAQWVLFSNTTLVSPASTWYVASNPGCNASISMHSCKSIVITTCALAAQATALFYKDKQGGKFEALLSVLQTQLGDKQFLEGTEFSLSDVAVGSHLLFTDVFMPEVSCELHKNPNGGVDWTVLCDECCCSPRPMSGSGCSAASLSWS